MFCINCGKQLEDGVKFCDNCGAQIGVSNSSANGTASGSVQNVGNPTMGAVAKTLKGFFSKDTVKTVGESAKSKGMEWAIIGLISVLAYSFALALNVKQILDSLLGSVSDLVGNALYNFGTWFLYGLLISVGTYFLMSFCIFGAMKLILKKNVALVSVLNLVATASLPLAIAYVLNIIFGFLWTPFIIIFSVAALIATAVLLYVGIQKLDKLDKSPYVMYVGIWTVVVAIIVIIINIVVKNAINEAISGLTGSLGNSLLGGGLSDMYDMFG